MSPCLVEGCDKPAGMPGTARGWCSTHYTRWQRTGNPLTTLTALKPRPDPFCAVDGCGNPRWALGYCGTHYRRFVTRGDAGSAELEWSRRLGKCSVAGCARPDKSKGMCQRHYLRARRHGDPNAGGSFFGAHDVCMAFSCRKPHYARGLCHGHWAVIGGRRRGVQSGSVTPEQLAARIDYFGNRCWMCGGIADQIDHVKPISAGGSNWPSNLRPACAKCNMRKHSSWPFALEGISA